VIQTAWFRVALAALRDAGVRTLVVSPGSRSTPLVAGAIAAELELVSVTDERSAAHFALGRARVTGEPTAVLCTSGSAATCYFPAVVEAAAARLPLVVLTADRPPELHGCEAPQTIDQQRLFGGFVRSFVDLGAPSAEPRDLRAVRRVIAQAVARARGPEPGPVHINAPARKPLEPARLDGELARWVGDVCAEPLPATTPCELRVPTETLERVADMLAASPRGVITLGPRAMPSSSLGSAVAALAQVTGFPLLAEATSQLRLSADGPPIVGSFDLLYQTRGFDADPEVVLQLGAPPTSSAWAQVLERARPRRAVISEHGWPDPHRSAECVANGDLADAVVRLAALLPPRRADASWRARFESADAAAWRLVAHELEQVGELSEGQAVRAVLDAAPAGALLSLGNSLPVRTVDTFVPPRAAHVGVLSQRGVSGIDGLVSAAAGAAHAADVPVVAILGDVSFGHDVGGLAATRLARNPLVVVVIDNGGGRIFERLPVAAAAGIAARFADLWLTPPACDALAVARAFGLEAHAVDSVAALRHAVASAASRSACTVIVARVRPGSADEARRRLVAALESELA
jgi:2-succinyl-5-enolpyruvyl-6-hydroxy-3-cyclohexene-1-carboxylate synthase